MAVLPVSEVVNVVVQLSPAATVRNAFNMGLVVGSTPIISVTERVRVYSNLNAMYEDGFISDDPEYIAVQRYFAQTPRPQKVAVGFWDLEHSETAADAVAACRMKNNEWYACTVCGAAKQDIIDIAAYIETAQPYSTYFYTTSDADTLTGEPNNIFELMKGYSYLRTLGQYSTDQDAVAAIMGYAMGANTGLANSAYTLAYKREVGVLPSDELNLTNIPVIKNNNGNVYINRGGTYNVFEQGVMANGIHFDEVINLDKLANDIQLAVMDCLTGLPKVPQTEAGVGVIVNAINGPCRNSRTRGFIAPGVWTAPPILSLSTGDMLSQGYLILSESVNEQDPTDRANRVAPPINVCVKLAGAIEFVAIQVLVNR